MGSPVEVELLVLDVDGILTDGGLYLGADGIELKRFSILDGLGIRAFLEMGKQVAIISGHASDVTRARFTQLGVAEIHVGIRDKHATLVEIVERLGFGFHQVAAMGDDLNDLPMLNAAAFAATVHDAHAEVRAVADLVTERRGGEGAVREVIEHILKAQDRYDDMVARFQP